jgi:hypothetical protein
MESSNQKIESSNQKMESSNQKMESSNQKMESSNQKIESSNQKMESSNQKINLDVKNEQVIYENCYLDKIIMENNNFFDCLVIKQGSIQHVSWFDPNYAGKLMELDLFKTVKTNVDNFIEVVSTNLNVDKYKIKNLNVKTEIVAEEPYYLYEMLYIDLEKATDYHNDNNLNELASLININGDKIYSDAIIFRNYLPSLSDSMTLCNISKHDLRRILHDRINTTVVIGNDDDLYEDKVIGDINQYAKKFFDDEKFKKIELGFLMHNINIWYSVSEYGNTNLCGNLINESIDKYICFSMKSDEFRGNITMDEVKKIFSLSKVLTEYKTPDELLEEKNDNFGRKIIYNKYKVLDWVYNKYFNKIDC